MALCNARLPRVAASRCPICLAAAKSSNGNFGTARYPGRGGIIERVGVAFAVVKDQGLTVGSASAHGCDIVFLPLCLLAAQAWADKYGAIIPP